MPPASALGVLIQWGKSLVFNVADSTYKKYERPLALRLLVTDALASATIAPPKELLSLTTEELLTLCLRDAYFLSTEEIATVFATSEGAIRTRLLSARLRCFAGDAEEFSKPSTPIFFAYADRIERADTTEELDALEKACGDDPKSNRAIRIKRRSLEFFASTPDEPIPEAHQALDVEPLLVRKGIGWKFNLGSSPWYLRILLEGLLSTLIVVSIVFAMPRAKKIYEFWIERRLDLYSLAEFTSGSGESMVATTQPNPTSSLGAAPPTASASSSAAKEPPRILSEFSGKESQKLSSNKLYRVSIKSENLDLSKQNILSALSQAKATPAGSDLLSELPGGIMFDMFVPLQNYPALRLQYPSSGEVSEIETHPKSAKVIPGKIHVMIWLH